MKTENTLKTNNKPGLSKQDKLFIALIVLILVNVVNYILTKKKYESQYEGLKPKVRVVKELAPPIAINKVQIPENISQTERQKSAASYFLGFYMVNDTVRPNFCLNNGVDISKFTAAFRQSHKSEYEIAIKIFSPKPSDLDEFYRILNSKGMKLVEKDMLAIAKDKNISVADACRLFSNDAESIVSNMHFSVNSPDFYRVLTSAI